MKVPFVSNTPDDLHCLQASYMMIAKAFDPSFAIAMDEWSRLTGFEQNKGTWASAGMLWFRDHGYEVRHISGFDYAAFVEKQGDYLIELTGEKVGMWQINHTNMPVEVERAKKLLTIEGIVEKRIPTARDIRQLIDDGYLIELLVNMARLNGSREKYVGHAVVVFEYDETGVRLHDPGHPPIEDRAVTWQELEAAWADPNDESKELTAIRRVEHT